MELTTLAMTPKILCTLGPTSMRPDVIRELQQRDVDLFRVNLSHTAVQDIEPTIEFLQRHTSVPICLDTEGAQVRCGVMADGTALREGDVVRLTSHEVVGTPACLTLRPGSTFGGLRPGMSVSIDFDGATLRVLNAGNGDADAVVTAEGRVRSNKGVATQPPIPLPAFTEKDVAGIAIAVRHGLRHFALSFASRVEDVTALRTMVPPGSYVIAKIENRTAVRHLEGILRVSDAVLVDRGDLSREVAIEHVPVYQKHIIRCANTWNRPVFVATNLLESMIQNRCPTVAEANDIMNTLLDGAHGLVLAAETAIGAYPIEAVDMVLRLIDAFHESTGQLIGVDGERHPDHVRAA